MFFVAHGGALYLNGLMVNKLPCLYSCCISCYCSNHECVKTAGFCSVDHKYYYYSYTKTHYRCVAQEAGVPHREYVLTVELET